MSSTSGASRAESIDLVKTAKSEMIQSDSDEDLIDKFF